MAITLRSIKGSELTFEELDENFSSIAPQTTTTGSLQLPAGDSSQRDDSPVNGYIRYNTGRGEVEAYIEGVWVGLATDVEQGELNQNAFAGIAVPGQGTIAADSTIDTLTIVGGTNIDITTTPATDTLTINNTFVQDFRYSQLTGVPTDVSTFTNDAGYLQDSEFTSEGIMRRGAGGNIYSVIPDNTSNWNLAYTWGDHAQAGYLTTVAMEDLTNVALNSVANGEVLIYNNGSWVNTAPLKFSDFTLTVAPDFQNGYLFYDENTGTFEYAAADLSSYLTSVAVNDLTDVTITNPDTLDIIYWNGSGWVNGSVADAGGSIQYTDLNVVQNTAAGNGSLTYDNAGRFEYTPPDLSIYITSEANDLSSNVTWANVPDAFITQSSVTQHQSALSITESQISDLQSYLTAVPAEYLTQSEGDARYLQSVPTEFLTQTEGDARYLQTETTYSTSVVDSGEDAIIRLTGSDASTDDITLVAGNNITLTPAASNITIDFAGDINISGSTISSTNGDVVYVDDVLEVAGTIVPDTQSSSTYSLGRASTKFDQAYLTRALYINDSVLYENRLNQGSTGFNRFNLGTYLAYEIQRYIVGQMVWRTVFEDSAYPLLQEIGKFNRDTGYPILDTNRSQAAREIISATQANPCRITSSLHGVSDGGLIRIMDAGTMTELSGDYYAKYIDANTLDLYTDAGLTTGVDSSAYTAFTSTGYEWFNNNGQNQVRVTIADALNWNKWAQGVGTPTADLIENLDYIQAIVDADYNTYKDAIATFDYSDTDQLPAITVTDAPLIGGHTGLGNYEDAGDPFVGNGKNRIRITSGSRYNFAGNSAGGSTSRVGAVGDLNGDFYINLTDNSIHLASDDYDGATEIWQRFVFPQVNAQTGVQLSWNHSMRAGNMHTATVDNSVFTTHNNVFLDDFYPGDEMTLEITQDGTGATNLFFKDGDRSNAAITVLGTPSYTPNSTTLFKIIDTGAAKRMWVVATY